MHYYRKNSKDNYEDDTRNLNDKIDIIYSLLENILNYLWKKIEFPVFRFSKIET